MLGRENTRKRDIEGAKAPKTLLPLLPIYPHLGSSTPDEHADDRPDPPRPVQKFQGQVGVEIAENNLDERGECYGTTDDRATRERAEQVV